MHPYRYSTRSRDQLTACYYTLTSTIIKVSYIFYISSIFYAILHLLVSCECVQIRGLTVRKFVQPCCDYYLRISFAVSTRLYSSSTHTFVYIYVHLFANTDAYVHGEISDDIERLFSWLAMVPRNERENAFFVEEFNYPARELLTHFSTRFRSNVSVILRLFLCLCSQGSPYFRPDLRVPRARERGQSLLRSFSSLFVEAPF